MQKILKLTLIRRPLILDLMVGLELKIIQSGVKTIL